MADENSPTQGGGSGIPRATSATQGEASGEVFNTKFNIGAIFNRLESLCSHFGLFLMDEYDLKVHLESLNKL